MNNDSRFEVEKVLKRWMLTVDGVTIPFFFETKKEAVAYARRKVNGHDAEWTRSVSRRQEAARALYRAWVRRFEGQIAPTDSDKIIFEYRPQGNLIGELPLGARPLPKGECGTLDRTDGGDPFEWALFTSPSGRVYVVERQV